MPSESTQQIDSEIGETLSAAGKLQLADYARLLADNQRLLTRVSAAEHSARDFASRVREAEARQTFGAAWTNPSPAGEGADDMQIYIDSPITVQGPQAPQPAGATAATLPAGPPNAAAIPGTVPQPAVNLPPSTLSKLAPWLLGAAAVLGGPAGYGVAKLLTPVASAVAPVVAPAVQPAAPAATPATVYDILPWRPTP